MRRQRIGLCGGIVGATLALAAMAGAEEIVLDDFADGNDDGWIRHSSGEIFEVVDGAYRLATRATIPVGQNGGFVIARLAVADDPKYQNGYFRARIRANSLGTSMNMTLRATPNVGAGGYNFYANTSLGLFGLERVGSFLDLASISGFRFSPEEDWLVEVGAVGDQLSMRVWRVGDIEPFAPQFIVTDSTYSTGGLLIFNFASFHQQPTVVDGVWDDITFRPGIPAQAFANATPSEGIAPLSVRFSAEGSPECEDAEFEWTLPDGKTLAGAEFDHVFVEPGRHVVTLALRSDDGCRASTNVAVSVHPAPGILDPWQASVVGTPRFEVAGHATQGESGTSFELAAGGRRLTGSSDAFGFVHRELDCDGVLVARIDEVTNTRLGSQIGLQMRENLQAGARHASLILEILPAGGAQLRFLHRRIASKGTLSGRNLPAISTPVWLKLERRGDVVTGFSSTDGTTWIEAGIAELLGLDTKLLVGVAAIVNEPPLAVTSFLLLRTRLSGVDVRCGPAPAFRRGDTNGDGTIDLSDPVATFGHLFLGGEVPACADAEDADDSNLIDLTDGIYTLNYLFIGGGPAPPEPGPEACGADPSPDELDECRSSCP